MFVLVNYICFTLKFWQWSKQRMYIRYPSSLTRSGKKHQLLIQGVTNELTKERKRDRRFGLARTATNHTATTTRPTCLPRWAREQGCRPSLARRRLDWNSWARTSRHRPYRSIRTISWQISTMTRSSRPSFPTWTPIVRTTKRPATPRRPRGRTSYWGTCPPRR